jgi:flagellar FliL protein
MSEKDGKDAAPAAGGGSKGGVVPMVVGILATAALSGGAAFGGARLAASKAHAPEAVTAKPQYAPPGITIQLDPFIAATTDGTGKSRTVKLTVAIELEKEAKEEEFKVFVPRIRDTTLTFLRTLNFEQMTQPDGIEKLRKDLLERVMGVGATQARQVLVTDLISQ